MLSALPEEEVRKFYENTQQRYDMEFQKLSPMPPGFDPTIDKASLDVNFTVDEFECNLRLTDKGFWTLKYNEYSHQGFGSASLMQFFDNRKGMIQLISQFADKYSVPI